MAAEDRRVAGSGTFAPLRVPLFRRVWAASLLSNFGQLILGVGAAWEMTRLTSNASMVALVQTALMVPLVLVSPPAGAIADMFDRRRTAMAGLAFSTTAALALTGIAWFGAATPMVLLLFCILIGSGAALYSPAWQASIPEQVGPEHLPSAVALGTISYNVARSVGPAIGGLLVLAAGAQAAFAVNAICYLPLLAIFFLWRRAQEVSRLPRERLDRALVAGARYALHSEPLRVVFMRALLFGFSGASQAALMPLVAKELLGGDASTYGLLLGASGIGAFLGALLVGRARAFGTAAATRMLAVLSGFVLIVIGYSHSLALTVLALGAAGAANIVTVALFNISVQLSVPRWVTARALSLFSASLTGGIALGAWVWGALAEHSSISIAFALSGALMALNAAAARWLPLPDRGIEGLEPALLGADPEVGLALTLRSGPIVIEVDYRVDPALARRFYDAMLKVQRTRLRNGAFGWSLSRDIADPWTWTERYSFPTWSDYLRLRERMSTADLEAQCAADELTVTEAPRRIRRRLERPFGSVRWKAESPDPKYDALSYTAP